jgi:hypothetical protein
MFLYFRTKRCETTQGVEQAEISKRLFSKAHKPVEAKYVMRMERRGARKMSVEGK